MAEDFDMLAADFGIRQLYARFADAAWRQDADQLAACWATDGWWKIAGLTMTGRAQIAQAGGQLLGHCSRVHLVTGLPIVERDGDGVVGRVPMTELAWLPDGNQFMTVGIYHDRYVQEGGQWRFAERFWSLKFRGPVDLSAPLVDTPDYGAFPNRPGPDETTYVRKG